MEYSNILDHAKKIIQIEIDALLALKDNLGDDFVRATDMVFESEGRLILCGIGKSALVAKKIVATLNSTGTSALFLHASEAIHGDLGMIGKDDILLFLSRSGETEEIVTLARYLRDFPNQIMSMVGDRSSILAELSDVVLYTPIDSEADPNNLAPTASTTSQMAMGDALALCLAERKGFTAEDFAIFHPGGSLGRKLKWRIQDLLSTVEPPTVYSDSAVQDLIVEMSSKRKGAVAVLDRTDSLVGIITDGDLRRMLQNKGFDTNWTAADIMSSDPKVVQSDTKAIDALLTMEDWDISQIIVLRDSTYVGIVHIHELLEKGLRT